MRVRHDWEVVSVGESTGHGGSSFRTLSLDDYLQDGWEPLNAIEVEKRARPGQGAFTPGTEIRWFLRRRLPTAATGDSGAVPKGSL